MKDAIKDWSDILETMGAMIMKDAEFLRGRTSCDYILALLPLDKANSSDIVVMHGY
jgi:hypothetical protein